MIYSWNIAESGVRHNKSIKSNLNYFLFIFQCLLSISVTVKDNQGVFMVENVLILVTVNVRLDLMATTVDFGQVCIVFLFRYCTLGYDCWLRSGMYCASLQVMYLRLRLLTSVRYVLCFSSGNVPWATTVDFGQVCIVFLFR